MSYKYSVLSDSPAAYWDLSASTTGNATKIYSSGSMITTSSVADVFTDAISSASSYFVSASYSSPPLVSNASSALYITSGNQYIVPNNLDTFYKKYEDTAISIEFWFCFDETFDGSGYIANNTASSRYFINNNLYIMRIMNGNNQIGSIYYNYAENKFVFSINPASGQTSSDAFFIPTNLDGSFHIVATYNSGNLSLCINGVAGVNGQVSKTNLFDNYTKTNGTFFIFEPSSLNKTTAYLINNVSIYQYPLSIEKIKKHMLLSFYTTDIDKYLQTKNISYFDNTDSATNLLYLKQYIGSDFNNNGTVFNLTTTPYGLKNNVIDNLSSYSDAGGSMTINSGSLSFTASGGAIFPSFINLISSKIYTTTVQFNCSNTNEINLFSLSGVNNQDYLYCNINPATGASIQYYNNVTGNSSLIAQISGTLSANTWYNAAFSTDGNNYYFNVNGNSASGAINDFFGTSNTLNSFSLSPTSQLFLGNFPKGIKAANTLRLKNIGVFNYSISNFSSFDFTDNKMLMARINNNSYISQTGYWQGVIPITSFDPGSIVGSKMTWETMDNCIVQVSNDNGKTWTTANKNNYIPYVYPSQTSGNVSDLLVRVIINTDVQIQNKTQTFNDLKIYLYNNLQSISSDNSYHLDSATDSSGKHSFIKKNNNAKILTRPKNLGIHFEGSDPVPGFANILTNSASPYAIDFWYRIASFNATADSYLIDSVDASGPELHIRMTNKDFSFNHATLYVNGTNTAANTFVPKINDFYHICLVFDARYSSSALYLNGKTTGAGAAHGHATYGEVTLWNENPSASDIMNKYKSYISNNIATVADVASSSTYIFPTLSNDSVYAYKIG